MERIEHLIATMEPEDDSFVALCPELDVASQGQLVEDAAHAQPYFSCHPFKVGHLAIACLSAG
jgi:hypothetical protein